MPCDRLNRLPDLKFKYVEEEEPEEFFIPYVWTLATQVFLFIVKNARIFSIDMHHFSGCIGVGIA